MLGALALSYILCRSRILPIKAYSFPAQNLVVLSDFQYIIRSRCHLVLEASETIQNTSSVGVRSYTRWQRWCC